MNDTTQAPTQSNTGPIIAYLIFSLIVLGAAIGLTLMAKTTLLYVTGGGLIVLLITTLIFSKYCFGLSQAQSLLNAKQQEIDNISAKLKKQQTYFEDKNKTLTQQLKEALARKPEPQANSITKASSSFDQQTFIASTIHELRTPLTNMVTLLDLLTDTDLDETQADHVETTLESAHDMLALSNNLLDLAKMEANQSAIEYVNINVQNLLQKALSAPSKTAEQKGLKVESTLANDVPTSISSDPTKLRQVLTNLVNNAIKFTEQGHIVIRVNHEANQNTQILRFMVQDSGIGISPAAQKRLFKPFAQADRSISQKYGGSGLGLSISKRIIESLGGTIGVKSEADKGSIFWFTIPVNGNSKPIAPPTPSPRPSTNTQTITKTNYKGKILVIDGDKINLGMTQKIIEEIGAQADVTLSVDEAINNYQNYDLIVINQVLQDSDAFDLTRQIRRSEQAHGKHTPIVIITSNNSKQDQQRCGAAGADGILKRPLKRASLVQMLNRWQQKASDDAVAAVTKNTTTELIKTGSGRFEGQVLLVDDNPHNLKVAKNVLKMIGVFPDEAVNGQEAVDAVAKQNYDVILMDCQMPVMDGYDATRHIRAHDQQNGQHTPVIAVTANALPSDQERCKECGMDDFIAKPITKENLSNNLINWLSEKPVIPENEYSQHISIDPEIIKQLQDALAEEFPPLITAFAESAPTLLTGARLAIANKDETELVNSVASLAGSCQDLGANKVTAMLKDLEKLAHANDFATASALWDLTNTELQKVQRALKKIK